MPAARRATAGHDAETGKDATTGHDAATGHNAAKERPGSVSGWACAVALVKAVGTHCHSGFDKPTLFMSLQLHCASRANYDRDTGHCQSGRWSRRRSWRLRPNAHRRRDRMANREVRRINGGRAESVTEHLHLRKGPDEFSFVPLAQAF